MKKALKKKWEDVYSLGLYFKSPIDDISQNGDLIRQEFYNNLFDRKFNSDFPLALIISKIVDFVLMKIPEMWRWYDYFYVINSILLWRMNYEFYTSWPYWDKLIECLDMIDSDKQDSSLFSQVNFVRNKFVYEYLEEFKWSHLLREWDSKSYFTFEYHEIEYKYYKLSKRWLIEMQGINIDEEIIRWIKECYVRSCYVADFRILKAIIAYVYFDIKLYIYFNPQTFELGICDKDNLDFQNESVYIVSNFSWILDQILWKLVIDKLRQKSVLKTQIDNHDSDDDKIIKALNISFDELMNVAINHWYDDFSLTMNWYVNDLNRFHELDEKTKFWSISFSKYANKKQRINVTTVKTLKDVLKSLKKK